ncbi:MAG: hypothetical protein NTV32_09600 [Gammaproteobacteria bacterium]|nr:hypothetical protein [Gammaproteobacteria bacterium]
MQGMPEKVLHSCRRLSFAADAGWPDEVHTITPLVERQKYIAMNDISFIIDEEGEGGRPEYCMIRCESAEDARALFERFEQVIKILKIPCYEENSLKQEGHCIILKGLDVSRFLPFSKFCNFLNIKTIQYAIRPAYYPGIFHITCETASELDVLRDRFQKKIARYIKKAQSNIALLEESSGWQCLKAQLVLRDWAECIDDPSRLNPLFKCDGNILLLSLFIMTQLFQEFSSGPMCSVSYFIPDLEGSLVKAIAASSCKIKSLPVRKLQATGAYCFGAYPLPPLHEPIAAARGEPVVE